MKLDVCAFTIRVQIHLQIAIAGVEIADAQIAAKQAGVFAVGVRLNYVVSGR